MVIYKEPKNVGCLLTKTVLFSVQLPTLKGNSMKNIVIFPDLFVSLLVWTKQIAHQKLHI